MSTKVSWIKLAPYDPTTCPSPLFLNTIVEIYEPALNRLRFGLLTTMGIVPCSYGTPRRALDAEGNAPYHPHRADAGPDARGREGDDVETLGDQGSG